VQFDTLYGGLMLATSVRKPGWPRVDFLPVAQKVRSECAVLEEIQRIGQRQLFHLCHTRRTKNALCRDFMPFLS
jgi:hypothetical protein